MNLNKINRAIRRCFRSFYNTDNAFKVYTLNWADNICKGGNIEIPKPVDTRSRDLIMALSTIYVNVKDEGLKNFILSSIKEYFNPVNNQEVYDKIVNKYNSSKAGFYPIKEIDPYAKKIMEQVFEKMFIPVYKDWIKRSAFSDFDNIFVSGNLWATLFVSMLGGHHSRDPEAFPAMWNKFMNHKNTKGNQLEPVLFEWRMIIRKILNENFNTNEYSLMIDYN